MNVAGELIEPFAWSDHAQVDSKVLGFKGLLVPVRGRQGEAH